MVVMSFFSSVKLYAGTNANLQNISAKYRESKLVEMNVEKLVKSELLGKETKYLGKIFLAKGKFRWENTAPEKSLLVFDGALIWSEQSPAAELGGPIQVAKGKVDKKTSSHILISSVLGADLSKNFKVVKESKDGDHLKIELSPLKNDLNINSLQITVNTTEKVLKSLSYTDDIGNLTTMNFSQVQFLKKEKKNLFKYQPPKGAQVTDL